MLSFPIHTFNNSNYVYSILKLPNVLLKYSYPAVAIFFQRLSSPECDHENFFNCQSLKTYDNFFAKISCFKGWVITKVTSSSLLLTMLLSRVVLSWSLRRRQLFFAISIQQSWQHASQAEKGNLNSLYDRTVRR